LHDDGRVHPLADDCRHYITTYLLSAAPCTKPQLLAVVMFSQLLSWSAFRVFGQRNTAENDRPDRPNAQRVHGLGTGGETNTSSQTIRQAKQAKQTKKERASN
jgi:hypothetical protein